MAAGEPAGLAWVQAQLAALDVDDADVYGQYVWSMAQDEDMDLDERVEAVQGALAAVTEAPLDDFCDGLRLQLDAEGQRERQAKEEEAAAARAARQRAVEAEQQVAAEAAEAKRLALPRRTREEQRERDALLKRYAFEDEFDEEGNVVRRAGADAKDADAELLGPANANRALVQDAQRAQRERARAEHQQQQAVIKRQQEAEKAKKEKKKTRTQKREKRRGCG